MIDVTDNNSQTLTREQVASIMDATLLKPEATREDVDALIAEARELGCGAVCVSPSMIPAAPADSSDSDATAGAPVIATVAGFPSGKHATLVKATEARFAVELGADEVDVPGPGDAQIGGDGLQSGFEPSATERRKGCCALEDDHVRQTVLGNGPLF